MRDAHQSLLATRVRTEDLVHGATVANEVRGRHDIFTSRNDNTNRVPL